MNPDPIEKFFKKADNVKLDEKKKDAIHQEVLLFMKRNPFIEGNIKKSWFGLSVPNISDFRLKTPAVVLAGIMLFLLVGGVVSVKADTALPGDVLYTVKIGFNEKIEEALAFSDKAKLNLNIKLAELRLQEAEQLALQGKLNSGNETQINNNFSEHANQASAQLNILKQVKDNQGVQVDAINFEASLKAQGLIISGLQENIKNNATGVLLNDIESMATKVSGFSSSDNSNADSNISVGIPENISDVNKNKDINKEIFTVEDSINVVKKLIEDNKAALGAQAVLQSEGDLNLAQQKIDEGKTQVENNNYQASTSLLQQASVITQETQDLINVKTYLGINIPINIPLGADAGSGNNQNTSGIYDNQKNQIGHKGAESNVNIKSVTNMNTNINTNNNSVNTGVSVSTDANANSSTNTNANVDVNASTSTGAGVSTNTGISTNTDANTTTKIENSLNESVNNLLK